MEHVSAVAVTIGPGLAPCLKAGLSFAKEISHKYKWVLSASPCHVIVAVVMITCRKPLIPVHHMEAHAMMPRLQME